MATARLANVLVGYPQPMVSLGGGDQRLQQLAVTRLDRTSTSDLVLSLGESSRQGIANPFELTDPEHSWTSGSADRPFDPSPGKGRHESLTQLALEASDLAAKLIAGEPLGSRIDGGR